MFRVLRPKYIKTGETTQTPDGLIKWNAVEWVHQGYAESLEEAKAKFGGYPVLELVGRLQ